MNSYELSRAWFDFCFENPEKIKPNHTAIYFFAIEHCNRLGWKEKFGFPTTMAMEAVGIKSYNTYINTFNDLVEWKFLKIIERSKNQYSANIVALSNFNKALNKALDKALIKHTTKQSESIVQSTSESISSINKQETTKPIKPINNILIREAEFKNSLQPYLEEFGKDTLNDFYLYWTEKKPKGRKMLFEMQKTFDIKRRLCRWNKNNFTQKEKSFAKKEKLGADKIILGRMGIIT